MPLIEITDFHAENLYEYSFDQMVDTFKPLKNKEEKKYIKIHKYPAIFGILPYALKKEYPNLSKAGIQLYATRLGLSIFGHDQRSKDIIDKFRDSMYNTSPDNISAACIFRHKILYDFCTPTSNNMCAYMATTEEVKSYISENGDSLGLSEYHLALMLFFLGVERATLTSYHRELVTKEIDLCWKILEMRTKSLSTEQTIDE